MVTINEIDANIRRLTGEHPEARPFLCEGSPIGAEVFLVGINPGTSTPFWPYWRLPYGCYKNEWIQAYLKSHKRFKITRARIERLVAVLDQVKYLETNVYFRYTPDADSLPKDLRDIAVFRYLFQTLKPTVMFVHGDTSITCIEYIIGRRLARGQFTSVSYRDIEVDVLTGPHFRCNSSTNPEKGWIKERVDAIGRDIQQRCILRRD